MMKVKHRFVIIGMFAVMNFLACNLLLAANSLNVNAAAALEGNFGLQIVFDGSVNHAYVRDDTPSAEKVYRASFLFNPNGIAMAPGSNHVIFSSTSPNVIDGGFIPSFRLFLYHRGGRYDIRGAVSYNRNTKWLATGFLPIAPFGSSTTKRITVEWTAASGPGASDGSLSIQVENSIKKSAPSKNNLMTVELIRLGAEVGVDATTTGSYYLDEFSSFRTIP